MTTYLGKSCSFGLLRVPFVNCCQFMYLVIYFPFVFEGRSWDLIVLVPDHCLSFYLGIHLNLMSKWKMFARWRNIMDIVRKLCFF